MVQEWFEVHNNEFEVLTQTHFFQSTPQLSICGMCWKTSPSMDIHVEIYAKYMKLSNLYAWYCLNPQHSLLPLTQTEQFCNTKSCQSALQTQVLACMFYYKAREGVSGKQETEHDLAQQEFTLNKHQRTVEKTILHTVESHQVCVH